MRETKVIDVSQVNISKPVLKPRILEIISYISNGGVSPIVKLAPIVGKRGQYITLNRRSTDFVVAHKLMGLPLIIARFSRKLNRKVN